MRDGGRPEVSVFLPCHNEAATLEVVLTRLLALPESLEVLVVDDGSDDGTGALARRWAARDGRVRLLTHPWRRGKGAALRTALAAARGRWGVVQDGDLEYAPEAIPRLLVPLRAGEADLVLGDRRVARIAGMAPWARWGNRALSALASLLLGRPIRDLETGHKAASLDLWRRLALESDDFRVEVEIVVKAVRLGARVVHVPVPYRPRDARAGKKLRWWDGLAALAALVRYRWGPLPEG